MSASSRVKRPEDSKRIISFRTRQSIALARALSLSLSVDGLPHAQRRIRRLETERAHVWDEMLRAQSALDSHIKSLNGGRAAFFERVAKILFDTWKPEHYAESMDAHTAAAKMVVHQAGEHIVPAYAVSRGCVTVVDAACGDGGVTAEFVKRVRTMWPDLYIRIVLNDISPNMVHSAESKVRPVLEEKGEVSSVNFNIVTKDGASALSGLGGSETADVVLIFQTLDVIRGFNAKVRALDLSYELLKPSGRLEVMGEDPPLLTIPHKTSAMVELLFRMLFHETPYSRTVQAIRELKTTNPFVVRANQQTPIDTKHDMFLVVAEKP